MDASKNAGAASGAFGAGGNLSRMRALIEFVRGLAREISDETAYARYLKQTGRKQSAESWRDFTDRRYRRKYQNAKCC